MEYYFISIPGHIGMVRVTSDLYAAGVCDGILIYFYLISLSFVQQIGCYKGFSITTCVIAGLMFICYWAALDEFATVIHCYDNQAYDFNYSYRGYSPTVFYRCRIYGLNHSSASTGAALGGCLLVCALVETAISLTASIYYFGVMRCETTSPSVSNKAIFVVHNRYGRASFLRPSFFLVSLST